MTELAATRKSMKHIRDDTEYYAHQVEGIRKLAKMKSFILADQMGLGKSLEALTVFAIDVVMGWSETCLVVCPASLKSNWYDEVKKFTYGLHVFVLDGRPLRRDNQIIRWMTHPGPKILIVNYEQVGKHLEIFNNIGFDVVIYDEAHYIKNYKSQRTKNCFRLMSRRSFLLTGTPLLNHANELWPLLHKVSPTRFEKYWTFVNRFCVYGGFENKQIVGVKNERELREILGDYMMRRLKQDVLDLPEVQIIERRVDLLPEQLKLYKEVDEQLSIQMVGEPTPQDIENALTKFLRLKQICGTTMPFTGEDYSAKLDLAIEDDMELLENGEKIVVFTQFRAVQAAYLERLQTASKGIYPAWQLNGDVPVNQRGDIVKQWAAYPGPAALVCMLQVAGIGLNMTAARHASFIDELFVPGLNQQAIDRLHRIGSSTTQPVQIRKYICRNTKEERVQTILRQKAKVFGDIVEAAAAESEWKKKIFEAITEIEAA